MHRLGVFFLLQVLAVVPSFAAKPTDAEWERTRGEVAKLVRELDSDRFDVREKAAGRLQELVGKPDLQKCLAEEFQRVLVRADVSFEVRWQLNRWMRQLPAAVPGPAAADRLSGEQLDELVRQLDDDRYAARVGAARRLDWLLTNPKYACPVLVRLKRCWPGKRSAWRPGSGSNRLSSARGGLGSPAIRPGGTCRRSPTSRSTGG